MFSKFTVAVVMTTLASLGLFSQNALADKMGPSGDKFYEEAARFENACSNDPCKAPYAKATIYKQRTGLNKLSAQVRTLLKQVAVHQAQIWGDTILEGDYYANGRTRLDEVVGFYKNGQIVGYKIQYSEKAWYTGDCQFNGKKESLVGCQEGRIVEGSYVSPDTETFFSDEERYAEFSLAQE